LLSLTSSTTFVQEVKGDAYTFPVKSKNLDKWGKVVWYSAFSSMTGKELADMHPVIGKECSGGNYVVWGKWWEYEGGPEEAFAMKISKTGTYMWGWSALNSGKKDVASGLVSL